ncbi:glycopeptide antibiotics resistance protein [Alkalihalobacillus xiaoxiensis]|uniref:Glycopeptide antibiotics resistance protein n=1 Tax=Shouchella xiaoxiensis TaxID=766895 RepID=A0ABS2SQN7_9BACI|nr:VanZ family protein [Shouchella xiaoxiensis]MBM7837818.1 glycopeptide antibiotics resistance protein [Shouchella xiaoxiensis]
MAETIIPASILLFLVLVLFFIYDLIRQKRGWLNRGLQIVFGFYLLRVVDETIGSIHLSPQETAINVQLIPFQFVGDIFSYEIGSFLFFNAIRISFYNVLLLAPLGVFLFLFGWRKGRRVLPLVFLVSLTIELLQLLLSAFGFIWPRVFDSDDLILNTAGGLVGFYSVKGVYHFIQRFR